MKDERNKNFDWLVNQNLSAFQGFWVTIVDQQIVTKGKSITVVLKETRNKYPNKIPFLFKVPTERVTL
jgi:hypothetical protein